MSNRSRSVSNGRAPSLHAGITAAVLMFAAMTPAPAEIPQNARAAEDAVYPCDMAGDAGALLARARELSRLTSERNKLACAADIYAKLAAAGTPDKELLADALAAGNSYLKQVNIERDLDFVGAQTGEWLARTAKVSGQLEALRKQASSSYADDLTLKMLGAQADLLVNRYSDPKDFVVAFRRSTAALNQAIGAAPPIRNGAAFVYLGKAYLDTPPIFGGSPSRPRACGRAGWAPPATWKRSRTTCSRCATKPTRPC